MSLISLIIILALIGVVLWFVNVKIPMPGWLKTCINVVAAICVVMFLLQAFGVLGDVNAVRVPHVGR